VGAVLAVNCVEQRALIDPVPIDLASCRPYNDNDPGQPKCLSKLGSTVNANFDRDVPSPPGIWIPVGRRAGR
jgi:hypothetical protein